ncbi:MAG: iron-containing alcohol dehydrogenase [Rhodobiaceae bacterium]|nr:iron-containing alcohol dehydrogenase [Rhodobiaceae bacterium]MCC0054607.1 iron-containing alcohol dehydrogenase [Rhodobiaceae bacterium]
MQPGTYNYPRADNVHYGMPWLDALKAECDRLGTKRVFVVSSATLLKKMPLAAELKAHLGSRLAGVTSGIRAHSPSADVVRIAGEAREANADLLVGIGGSSITDAVKGMRIALAANVSDPAGLSAYRNVPGSPAESLTLDVPAVAVPTTLSGAEFTALAGITNLERGAKESYRHRDLAPTSVILDPAATLDTPDELWLSSGVRAVHHAVADICSINAGPFSDAASIHALKLLLPGLMRTREAPEDLAARLDCMVGAWLSLVGVQGGVEKGIGHAIGHILGGSAGVPHGITSCLMLPHELRWNAPVNAAQQKLASEAMGDAQADAADICARFIEGLGLPHRLQDVGVEKADLDRLSELTMKDRWTATNPRPVKGPEDVREILEMAW